MFYLRKIAAYPFECLPTGRLNRKERHLAAYNEALEVSLRPPQRPRVRHNTRPIPVQVNRPAEHKSFWSRVWEWRKKEVFYPDHLIYEMKGVRLFTLSNDMNPLLQYVSLKTLTVVNRDLLRLPMTFLMLYKFSKKGYNDLVANKQNYAKYLAHRDSCAAANIQVDPSTHNNSWLTFGLVGWGHFALSFTCFKFARDLFKLSLKGYSLSTLANGVVNMTPQWVKTESTVNFGKKLYNFWHAPWVFRLIEWVYFLPLMAVIVYGMTTDAFVLGRHISDWARAKPLETEDPTLVALIKRRNSDKNTFWKRMINFAVSTSTFISSPIFYYEPLTFFLYSLGHCGLVIYQNHYRFRMTEVRQNAVNFWKRVETNAEREKLVEGIVSGRVKFSSKKIQAVIDANNGGRVTRQMRAQIDRLLQQKAQRQLIKNLPTSEVAAKVYDLICQEESVTFFERHFNFSRLLMGQIRDRLIPREQAILFIQDQLHMD